MRRIVLGIVILAACGDSSEPARLDAAPGIDGHVAGDAATDAATGFGTTGGMCDVLAEMDLTGPTPQFFRPSFTFERPFVDPDDRPLLTPGGQHIRSLPNAGGSSILSEVFAFEHLARCEGAELLKAEIEIVYDTPGKTTDILVRLDEIKIGVSVTRTFGYPYGTPYTFDQATTLIQRKLEDIQESSRNVSEEDRWQKQFLSVLAWDDATVETVHQAWLALPAETKADTQMMVIATHGEDLFIYDE